MDDTEALDDDVTVKEGDTDTLEVLVEVIAGVAVSVFEAEPVDVWDAEMDAVDDCDAVFDGEAVPEAVWDDEGVLLGVWDELAVLLRVAD